MRTYRTAVGPFAERPHFSIGDVERICEEALAKEDLLPATPEPIRIERFLEKHFKVTPDYEDLGVGVLGFSTFNKDGISAIYVSRSLSEDGTQAAERRTRTTFAHEAGHGLLHSHLFAFQEGEMLLFAGDPDVKPTKILCRDDESSHRSGRYSGKWWEYQANLAMGALLLPHPVIDTALAPFLIEQGRLGFRTLDPNQRKAAILAVAEIFDVNPIAAQIRLDSIFQTSSKQPCL